MKFLSVKEIAAKYPFLPPPLDLQGWNSDHELFTKLVTTVKPKSIIEVGTYKGRSALHMAELTKDLGTKIYCVDTWLGNADFTTKDWQEREEDPCLYDHVPLWFQFLANVLESGYADRIFPIPQTAINAVRLLVHSGVRGDLIYIDADHTYRGCFQDLECYAGLLTDVGIMFGDDFVDFPGVRMAVSRFAFENNLRIQVSGPAWVLSSS